MSNKNFTSMKKIFFEKGRKVTCEVNNREEFIKLKNSPDNLFKLEHARKGNADAKSKLVQFAYNDLMPDGLVAGCCHPSSYFFHDIDCYDSAQAEATKEKILSLKEQIGLMMLERSVNGGWHLVCRREKGKTILENQVRIACILKMEMDTNCHDLGRVVFSTSGTSHDLVYLDDAIFEESMSVEESEQEYQVLKNRERRGLEEVPAGAKKDNKHYRPWEEMTTAQICAHINETEASEKSVAQTAESAEEAILNPTASTASKTSEKGSPVENSTQAEKTNLEPAEDSARPSEADNRPAQNCARRFPTSYHGHTFEEIIAKYWEMFNNGFTPTVGDRDAKTYELAYNLRHICNNNFDWLDEVIPCYDGFTLEEKRTKIRSALKSTFEGLPRNLTTVLNALDGKTEETPEEEAEALKTASKDLYFNAPNPPELPKKLPRLIKLLTKNTPDIYKPAVASAVFPSLATHLYHTTFKYTDKVEHEATLMDCVMAESGAGKSCIDKPIDYIMADIRERDAMNEQRLDEYNDKVTRQGSNREKPKRPEGLIIQEVNSDMTNAGLVLRMAEAEEHFLYTKVNEIQQFDALRGNGKVGHQYTVMCLSFDPGNRYGQTRAGSQSINKKVCMRFNWNASTTINKGKKYFRNVLTDGPVQRISFCTIPEREIGAEQPIFGEYTEAFAEELRPYILNLCNANGLIDCPEANRTIKKLQKECMDLAVHCQSRVFEKQTYRACVIAWLKACVLYVANGCKWEKSIEDFMQWSLHNDLWCKMTFFGEMIAADMADPYEVKRGPQNMLMMLKDEFTMDDLIHVRMMCGLTAKGAYDQIRQWKSRGYVTVVTDNLFRKLKYKAAV